MKRETDVNASRAASDLDHQLESRSQSTRRRADGMVCMVVDDLSHQLESMKRIIYQAAPGIEFIEARNRAEAMAVVKGKDRLDLAVVDLKLTPEGYDTYGIDVIQSLKKEPHRKNVLAILITAFPDPQGQAQAEQAGADGYINKLNDSVAQELQEMVRALLFGAKPKKTKKE